MWAKPRVRQALAVTALASLVGLSLFVQELSKDHVFIDTTLDLTASTATDESFELHNAGVGLEQPVTFSGGPGQAILFDSPAAELSDSSLRNLRNMGVPALPKALSEAHYGPALRPGEKVIAPTEPGCITTIELRPFEGRPLSMRISPRNDPGNRRAVAFEPLQGSISVSLTTGLPDSHSPLAFGCKMELELGSFRLVEDPPTRQEFLIPMGSELTLTFDTLKGASSWGRDGWLELLQSGRHHSLQELELVNGSARKPLLQIMARGDEGYRLIRLAIGSGALVASIHGEFSAAGIRRPVGGRSRLSLQLGPVVDHLWQMALASLYLAVFVWLKRAFLPSSSD